MTDHDENQEMTAQTDTARVLFPFAAFVNQAQAKEALILAVINPIPIADRFARHLAALVGAKHISVQKNTNSGVTGLNDV